MALRPLEKVIELNEVLTDLVLKWMLESIKTEDPYGNVILNIDMEIGKLITNIKNGTNTSSGDVYDNILWYGPGGKLFEVGSKMAANIINYLDGLPLGNLGMAIQDFFDLKLFISMIAVTRD